MWYKIHCQHLEARKYPLRFCSHASKCGKSGDVFVNLTGSWSALQPCSNLSKVSIAFIVSYFSLWMGFHWKCLKGVSLEVPALPTYLSFCQGRKCFLDAMDLLGLLVLRKHEQGTFKFQFFARSVRDQNVFMARLAEQALLGCGYVMISVGHRMNCNQRPVRLSAMRIWFGSLRVLSAFLLCSTYTLKQLQHILARLNS